MMQWLNFFIAFRFTLGRLVNLVDRMSSFGASKDRRLLYMSYICDVRYVGQFLGGFAPKLLGEDFKKDHGLD